MRTRDTLRLSFKYFLGYWRRYLFLFAALSFGFCVISVIVSVKDSMARNMYYSAQGHYAGDISIEGRDTEGVVGGRISNEYISIINNAISRARIEPDHVVMRTRYASSAALFHNGESVTIKYLMGLDWRNEAAYLRSLPFVRPDAGRPEDGGAKPDALVGANAPVDANALGPEHILLSQAVAQRLQARTGDLVILEAENRWGQKNTAAFVVGGVFADSSIFGFFKSFIDRETMNTLLGFEEGECSLIGLYFKNVRKAEERRRALQNALEGALQISGYCETREDWDAEKSKDWNGIMLFLLSLPVYLSDVTALLQSINILAFLLYIMMLIIIFASAIVTYRLIFHERARELAAMRAIGFSESGITGILTMETVFLATVSMAAGFLLSLAGNYGLSRLSFEWFPSLEMFLNNGRLQGIYKPGAALLNAAAVYGMLIAAVFAPAYRLSRSPLAQGLAGSVKE